MANRIIYTTPFRVNFPHLDAPHAQKGSTETPKFSTGAMFPKSGMMPTHVANGVASSNQNILDALDEVCQEAFGINYTVPSLTFTQGHTLESFPAAQGWTTQMIIDQGYAVAAAGISTQNNAALVGVNFPPPLVDGDFDFKSEKNTQGVSIKTNVAHESSVGMWKMGFKNVEPVGVCDPTGQHIIDPKSIYSGCWVVAELEVTAYVGGKGNVIAVKLLNVQMAFNDERLGGGAHITQAATSSFANRAIAGSNVEAGYGQNAATAVPTPQPVAVAPVAVAPVAAAPAPVAVAPVAVAPVAVAPVAAAPVAAAPVAAAPVAAAPVAAAPVYLDPPPAVS